MSVGDRVDLLCCRKCALSYVAAAEAVFKIHFVGQRICGVYRLREGVAYRRYSENTSARAEQPLSVAPCARNVYLLVRARLGQGNGTAAIVLYGIAFCNPMIQSILSLLVCLHSIKRRFLFPDIPC